METRDHLRLADWLLASRCDSLPHGFAAGVRLGSVLPDCNPFTYLRGLRGRQGVHGHNAEVTWRCICRLLSGVRRSGKLNFRQGLRLGTALHYLADAFTYPHHAYYPGTLAEHVAYEAALHRVFWEYLEDGCGLLWTDASDFPGYFADMLSLYRDCRVDARTDCRFITHMCGLAFETVVARPEGGVSSDENPDYDRPVFAVR